MIYKRITYRIIPDMLDEINHFFRTRIYPEKIKHRAKLTGRWVNDNQDEILEIWEYENEEHYLQVSQHVGSIRELEKLHVGFSEENLTSMPSYHTPKHIVSVCGYMTNEHDEVLLVRNLHRADTMEMPGGQVEEGETLEEAIHREVWEETGVSVSLDGITGIYQNITNNIVCVVFRGRYESGELTPQETETSEVIFARLTRDNINQFITRQNFRNRTMDAMEPVYLPYEAFNVRPYKLLSRFGPVLEKDE